MVWIIMVIAVIVLCKVRKAQHKREEEVLREAQREAQRQYYQMEAQVLKELGLRSWNAVPYYDKCTTVKSRQALESYDDVKYFRDNREMLEVAQKTIEQKRDIATTLKKFLESNNFKSRPQYHKITSQVNTAWRNAGAFRVRVSYISSAGNNLGEKEIVVTQNDVDKFRKDPSLLMGKGEYSKHIKEQQKEALSQKQHEYYERVNGIIDYANANRDILVVKENQKQLDSLISKVLLSQQKSVPRTNSKALPACGRA